MKLLALMFVATLPACVVGELGEDEDDIGAIGASLNPGDRLGWSRFSSNCARSSHGIVGNGQELSVLFDQGTQWKYCTFAATLRVPADVRIKGLTQYVRTEGGRSTLRYSANVNAKEVTAKTTNMRGTLEAYASLASIGDVLCRQPGGGDRYIPVSFSASVDGTNVALDSVDWAFDATNCK